MIGLSIFIFIISCLVLFWSGSRLVAALMRMARFLGWREFVLAFIVMAIAGSASNLFVGINSALQGIPELSFGDIVGGNVVDLTLAVALAVLIGGTSLPAKSKMVQTSTVFTAVIAVLPLILILDGSLGRSDGLILLFVFAFYFFWLFSKEERFKKVYRKEEKEEKKIQKPKRSFKGFLKDLRKVITSLVFLLLTSWGIVWGAQQVSGILNITLPIIGVLIIGLGNALPETYFAIVSARRKQTWMILGNLMGSVVVSATFVLGIVALINPIEILDFSPFAIARIFLVVSAFFFLIVVRSGQKITKKEALFLLLIYILFFVAEIFFG